MAATPYIWLLWRTKTGKVLIIGFIIIILVNLLKWWTIPVVCILALIIFLGFKKIEWDSKKEKKKRKEEENRIIQERRNRRLKFKIKSMNKEKLQKLESALETLEQVQRDLENIHNEERETYDNMSENQKFSVPGELLDEFIIDLDIVLEQLSDTITSLNEVIGTNEDSQ